MLATESGHLRGPGGTGRVVGAHAAHFVFGGVAFELLADRTHALPVDTELERFLLPASAAEGLPRVVAAVSWDRSLPSGRYRGGIEARAEGDRVELGARHLRGQLRALGAARYALDARIAPSDDGLRSLLLAASSAILQLEGGLNLHATAVELDGRALLLVAPSGTGKSTACDLIAGARCLANDRVTLTPSAGGGFHVWALPGGKPTLRTAQSAQAERPLAGVLRVRRGQDAPRLEPLGEGAALFALHEAVQSMQAGGPEVHERRLGALAAVCAAVPVGALYTVLGQPLEALVRQHLAGAAR